MNDEEGAQEPAPTPAEIAAQPAPRGKIKQKTYEQKLVLDKAFEEDKHPVEEKRRKLATALDLTMQEISSWFQNRRRRAKRAQETAEANTGTPPPLPGLFTREPMPSHNGLSAGLRMPMSASMSVANSVDDDEDDQDNGSKLFSSYEEYTSLLNVAKHKIPGYRADGPVLGFEYDQPKNKRKREHDDVGAGRLGADGYAHDFVGVKKVLSPEEVLARQLQEEECRLLVNQQKAMRHQQKVESSMEKERQRRMREHDRETQRLDRERARQDADRQKMEERQRKAMMKEHEKIEREQAKQQAKEERERARLAKLAEKQAQKQALMEQKESEKLERKKEKELARRAKAVEKRAVQKTTLKLREVGPPDDVDIEVTKLLKLHPDLAGLDDDGRAIEAVRPPFLPPNIQQRLMPAFTGILAENSCELAGNIMMVWNFVSMFADHMGLLPVSLHDLLSAIQLGTYSRFLSNLHIGFLRYIQADIEHAHTSGSNQMTTERANQAQQTSATLVEEAVMWGLDINIWRAHLNHLTWPEVLRQFALSAGWGPRRCRSMRARDRASEGTVGEDVEEGDDSSLRLRWPNRFQTNPLPGEHTVKEACWKVLGDMVKCEDDIKQAKEGLPIREIARRIEESGLRNSKGATTNEGSVAGALSRDQLFFHVAPGTYALHAIVAFWRKHKDRLEAKAAAAPKDPVADADAPVPMDSTLTVTPASSLQNNTAAPSYAPTANGDANGAADMDVDTPAAVQDVTPPASQDAGKSGADGMQATPPAEQFQPEEDDEDEEEEEEEEEHQGKSWVDKLLVGEYDSLDLGERVEALCDLMHQTLDTPSMRNLLDRRCDEVERVKRQMRDEAKIERRNLQLEQAAKAKKECTENHNRIAALKEQMKAMKSTSTTPTDTPVGTPGQPQQTPPVSKPKPGNATGPDGESIAGLTLTLDINADPETAAEDFLARVEAKQQHERDVSTTAAELQQRERLGETLRMTELNNAIRGEPFGRDRRYNRYCWYGQVTSKTRTSTLIPDRIFYEDALEGSIRMFTRYEDLADIRNELEPKGAREGAFARSFDHMANDLARSIPSATNGIPEPQPLSLPPGTSAMSTHEISKLQNEALDRYSSVLTHGTEVLGPGGGARPSDFLPDDPPAVKKLKSELLCIESAIPLEAMADFQDPARSNWVHGVQRAENLIEIRKLLGQLEAHLHGEWLSVTYPRVPFLVKGAFMDVGREIASVRTHGGTQSGILLRETYAYPEMNEEPLAWLPATTAAIALRLLALDAAVVYCKKDPPACHIRPDYRYIQHPVLIGHGENVATVSGNPVLGKVVPIFPPISSLPSEPVEFVLDLTMMGDEDHLRTFVPNGLRAGQTADGSKSKQSAKKNKKARKRHVEEDDAIYAADIISSEDDYDDVMAKYSYGGGASKAAAIAPSVDVVSDFNGNVDDDGELSISNTGSDEEDNDNDDEDVDFIR